MVGFKEWMGPKVKSDSKLWSASKDEIVDFWKTLNPNTSIFIKPIAYKHKGTTYRQDGIRITGSKEFINSVISRLKDLLVYESPYTKLSLVYKQTEPKDITNLKPTFAFYAQVRERGKPLK